MDFCQATETDGLAVVGYAIGRRHGGAVARNRLRRRLREAMRAAGPSLVPGTYLVRAIPGAEEVDFEELRRAAETAARAAADRARTNAGEEEGREVR